MKIEPATIKALIISLAYLLGEADAAGLPAPEPERPQLTDRSTQVFVGEKIMSYEAGLPILTQMLDGDVKQQAQAVGSLKYYGISLKGTDALKKLVALLERKDDFSVFDEKFKAVRLGTYTGQKNRLANNASEIVMEDLLQVKTDAMTAVVMSGAPEGERFLNRYLHSPSEMERGIAEEAAKSQEKEGTWKRGMIPTKLQPRLFSFHGQALLKEDYLAQVRKSLAAGDMKATANTVAFVAHGGSDAIKDSDVFDQLVKLFKDTARTSPMPESIRDMRENIVKIIGPCGDSRAAVFLQEAAKDPNSYISDLAASFLESIERDK